MKEKKIQGFLSIEVAHIRTAVGRGFQWISRSLSDECRRPVFTRMRDSHVGHSSSFYFSFLAFYSCNFACFLSLSLSLSLSLADEITDSRLHSSDPNFWIIRHNIVDILFFCSECRIAFMVWNNEIAKIAHIHFRNYRILSNVFFFISEWRILLLLFFY